ncbi:hypothetical protein K502DRAFT_358408 [Neoconidiobolus thromboides FSU 785]|nr:hypothetical protein K502DRAFT_358408 [Neoconidiobolus thromboides FSU 785]
MDLSYQLNIEIYQNCLQCLICLFAFECNYLLNQNNNYQSNKEDNNEDNNSNNQNDQIQLPTNMLFQLLIKTDKIWLEKLSIILIQNYFFPLIGKDNQSLLKSAYSYLFSNENYKPTTLSIQSLQIYLFLITHYENIEINPFLLVVENYFELIKLFPNPPFFHLNCINLFDKLISQLDDCESLILFYLFLNYNNEFKNYCFSLTDPSELVLSCLKGMYESTIKKENNLKAYLYTIILLKCTQSIGFLKNCCNKSILPPIWLTSRLFMELPLSDLTIHILIKYSTHYLNEPRDQFAYSIGMATLLNILPYCNNLTSLVVQKLFRFIELINKKRIKLGQNIEKRREDKLIGINNYEELICLLFHSILLNIQLQKIQATNLIYGLLQNLNLIESFEKHPFIKQVTIRLKQFCKPFQLILDNNQDNNNSITVEEVTLKISNLLRTMIFDNELSKEMKLLHYEPSIESQFYFKYLLWPDILLYSPIYFNDSIYLQLIEILWED